MLQSIFPLVSGFHASVLSFNAAIGLIMKKILMAAAAACALAFTGTAASADIPAPEGWTVTVVDGIPNFKKDSTGFAINLINSPANGYTLDVLAKEVEKTYNCKITASAQEEADLECPGNKQMNIVKSGAEQFTMITSACAQTDKSSCEADFKEFITFIASQGK